MILSQINELYKLVNVFLYRVLALVPTCSFQLHEGQELFIFGAEMVHEVSLKGVPVQVVRPSSPFTLEHLVGELSRLVRLEEGESPMDMGLLVWEVVAADCKVDPAGVEECSASVSVSIEV